MSIRLQVKQARFGGFGASAEPEIMPVTRNIELPAIVAKRYALAVDNAADVHPRSAQKFRVILSADGNCVPHCSSIGLPEDYKYLDTGDVVRINPRAFEFRVLYRRSSSNNSLLVTERCNSFCVMCSQPPRDVEDSYLQHEACQVIELVDQGTESLGITGGEPTLLGEGFLQIVRHARNYLPGTTLHVLTNGRRFQDKSFAKELAAVGHPNLILGIPLYSDQPNRHDFVVQAQHAFDETIKGILNLKACGIGIELRVVLHRQTYEGLPDLARFVSRNLAFVDYVALMGLELVGFAKSNLDALWIDPYEYREQLRDAIKTLDRNRIPVFLYNHQLCVVPEDVRKYCVQSISDWKNEYLPICDQCSQRHRCGGFFSTGKSLDRTSAHIHPL